MLKVNHELIPIFVKTEEIPLTKTRQAFIREFLAKKAVTTYSNLSCTNIQCKPGTNRSVSELHQIVISRFPKTSFDAILRIIKDLIDHEALVRLTYCTQIKKVVIMYVQKVQRDYVSPYARNEHYTTIGTDGYSLEIFEKEIKEINNK